MFSPIILAIIRTISSKLSSNPPFFSATPSRHHSIMPRCTMLHRLAGPATTPTKINSNKEYFQFKMEVKQIIPAECRMCQCLPRTTLTIIILMISEEETPMEVKMWIMAGHIQAMPPIHTCRMIKCKWIIQVNWFRRNITDKIIKTQPRIECLMSIIRMSRWMRWRVEPSIDNIIMFSIKTRTHSLIQITVIRQCIIMVTKLLRLLQVRFRIIRETNTSKINL